MKYISRFFAALALLMLPLIVEAEYDAGKAVRYLKGHGIDRGGWVEYLSEGSAKREDSLHTYETDYEMRYQDSNPPFIYARKITYKTPRYGSGKTAVIENVQDGGLTPHEDEPGVYGWLLGLWRSIILDMVQDNGMPDGKADYGTRDFYEGAAVMTGTERIGGHERQRIIDEVYRMTVEKDEAAKSEAQRQKGLEEWRKKHPAAGR